MSQAISCQNKLKRAGTTQVSRVLPALDPDSFKVDERTTADFLIFAKKFAKNIRFHESGLSSDANWQGFFQNDQSVTIATLSRLPLAQFLRDTNALVRVLQDPPQKIARRQSEMLGALFALYLQLPVRLLLNASEQLLSLAKTDVYHSQQTGKNISNKVSLHDKIKIWAQQHVLSAIKPLASYALGAQQHGLSGFGDGKIDATLLNDNTLQKELDWQAPAFIVTDILAENDERSFIQCLSDALIALPLDLSGVLTSDKSSIDFALLGIQADEAPFLNASSTAEKVDDATRFNLITNAISQLYSAIENLSKIAKVALQDDLMHKPHFGLWMTFLTLYKKPQALLNEFTGRHLAFYYQDILKQTVAQGSSDTALLSMTLAKNVTEHFVEKGTVFNGGKALNGEPRLYASNNDIVLNNAQLAHIKSWRKGSNPATDGILVSSFTNSANGIGGEFLKDSSQEWPLFGALNTPVQNTYGFAIADEKLRLRDGARSITLVMTSANGNFPNASSLFQFAISSAEGWLYIESKDIRIRQRGTSLSMSTALPADAPAIVGYSTELHAQDDYASSKNLHDPDRASYDVTSPVLEVWFRPNRVDVDDIAQWQNVRLSGLTISTEARGSRDFSLSNHLGDIDASKAFLPFGPRPQVGDELVLSSPAIFSKPLESFSIRTKWKEKAGGREHFYTNNSALDMTVTAQQFEKGIWQDMPNKQVPFFIEAGTRVNFYELLQRLAAGNRGDLEYENFLPFYDALIRRKGLNFSNIDSLGSYAELSKLQNNKKAQSGSLRFSLASDLGHDAYPQENALAIMGKGEGFSHTQLSNVNYSAGLPNTPYTPEATDLSVDYETTNDTVAQFFHLHPFGHKLTVPTQLIANETDQGACLLGFRSLKAGQVISLLMHAQAGSADPLSPPTQLNYAYLRDNDWLAFDEQAVSNSTTALSGSGIISFSLPLDANTQHSLLPSDCIWIKIAAQQNVSASANMLGIFNNAIAASMVERYDKDTIIGSELPASSIAKLLTPDKKIKSIEQPDKSFGGKVRESSAQFNQRVSQRLRHKNRAVCIWDFEHLILAQFPQVFRVRCLNHTQVDSSESAGDIEQGLRPGHALIVPLPVLSDISSSLSASAINSGLAINQNHYRPYCDNRLLQAITAFVNARKMTFAQVKVINPKIEEIKLSFDVAFNDDIIDVGFYLAKLNEDINRYMMPWAGRTTQNADTQSMRNQTPALDFSNKWFKSNLVNFIDECEYVDYIKDVHMFHRADITNNAQQWLRHDLDEVVPSTSFSVLVAYPQHDIHLIENQKERLGV